MIICLQHLHHVWNTKPCPLTLDQDWTMSSEDEDMGTGSPEEQVMTIKTNIGPLM